MQISRYGIVERPNHLPHISGAVAHGDIVYLQGVTPDPGGDISSQTRQVLEGIDALLAKAGTDKSKLLTAQVWLSDMRLFEAHNVAWNAWVNRENPPVRACVRADLVRPGLQARVPDDPGVMREKRGIYAGSLGPAQGATRSCSRAASRRDIGEAP